MATLQSVMSPASVALARNTPRGSKVSALIAPFEPARTLSGAPVAAFHNLICVSSPALAIKRPSGLKAIARIGAECPLRA